MRERMRVLWHWARHIHANNPDTPAIFAVITETKGSTPRRPATAMLITDNEALGTIGGGALEWQVIAKARALLQTDHASPLHEHFILGPDIGQCCGGALTLWFRPLTTTEIATLATPDPARYIHIYENRIAWHDTPKDDDNHIIYDCHDHRPHLMIFGAGHVAQACAKFCQFLPLRVTFFDDRTELRAQIIAAENITCAPMMAAETFLGNPKQAVLIMTHGHDIDYDCAKWALERMDFSYVGVIGSKTKAARFRTRLAQDGVSADKITALTMPIGTKAPVKAFDENLPEIIALSTLHDIYSRMIDGREDHDSNNTP
ncbi:MAG: xanthine dehydrogenase accessory protein XdhC [Pseudomonadota bacterium]